MKDACQIFINNQVQTVFSAEQVDMTGHVIKMAIEELSQHRKLKLLKVYIAFNDLSRNGESAQIDITAYLCEHDKDYAKEYKGLVQKYLDLCPKDFFAGVRIENMICGSVPLDHAVLKKRR